MRRMRATLTHSFFKLTMFLMVTFLQEQTLKEQWHFAQNVNIKRLKNLKLGNSKSYQLFRVI